MRRRVSVVIIILNASFRGNIGLLSFGVQTPESAGIIAVHRPGNDTGVKTAVAPYGDKAALAVISLMEHNT